MNNSPAALAHQVMVWFAVGCLVAGLFSREVSFAYEPQFSQQFQCAVNCRKAHIRIAFLDTFCDLINAQVLICFLNDTQNHVTLRCQPVSSLAQHLITCTHIVVHPLPLFIAMVSYPYPNIPL